MFVTGCCVDCPSRVEIQFVVGPRDFDLNRYPKRRICLTIYILLMLLLRHYFLLSCFKTWSNCPTGNWTRVSKPGVKCTHVLGIAFLCSPNTSRYNSCSSLTRFSQTLNTIETYTHRSNIDAIHPFPLF